MAASQSLAELGARLKRLERGDLRRELLKSIRTASEPLKEAARQSALENLPQAGGLGQRVAETPIVSRTSLSGSSARVRLISGNRRRLRELDRGRLRHPVFGNRDNWVTQQVQPGWWTQPMEAGSPHVRAAIVRAVDDISRRL